jgi:hypothetical protein
MVGKRKVSIYAMDAGIDRARLAREREADTDEEDDADKDGPVQDGELG